MGRARACSMVANLAALEALDKAIHEHDSSTSESVTGSVDSVQRMPDLLVESTNNKGQQQLQQQGQQGQFLAFSEEQNNNKMNSVIQSKVYASVAEMKRMKVNILFLYNGVSVVINVLFITCFDEINKCQSFTNKQM